MTGFGNTRLAADYRWLRLAENRGKPRLGPLFSKIVAYDGVLKARFAVSTGATQKLNASGRSGELYGFFDHGFRMI
jgi:hypothetical protein